MISIIPRATEKSYTEQTKNTYVFLVPNNTSKQEVAKNVEEQYKVTVLGVRILVRKGKPTKFSKGKHRYPGSTFRKDKKYAYVTLKAGDKIKVFDEEPLEEKKPTESSKNEPKAVSETASVEVKKAGLFAKRRTGVRGDK
ncbi:hypothetical protein FACS1894191_1590 [Clostridia bacterium]|nr:hypothetical protein FACS1894191_1590 [Clostridia bacterium]